MGVTVALHLSYRAWQPWVAATNPWDLAAFLERTLQLKTRDTMSMVTPSSMHTAQRSPRSSGTGTNAYDMGGAACSNLARTRAHSRGQRSARHDRTSSETEQHATRTSAHKLRLWMARLGTRTRGLKLTRRDRVGSPPLPPLLKAACEPSGIRQSRVAASSGASGMKPPREKVGKKSGKSKC